MSIGAGGTPDGSTLPKTRTGDKPPGVGEEGKECRFGEVSPHSIIKPGEKGFALHHTSKNKQL